MGLELRRSEGQRVIIDECVTVTVAYVEFGVVGLFVQLDGEPGERFHSIPWNEFARIPLPDNQWCDIEYLKARRHNEGLEASLLFKAPESVRIRRSELPVNFTRKALERP